MKAMTTVEARRFLGQLEATLKLAYGGTLVITIKEPWYCHCRCRTRIEHAVRVAEQATGVLKAASGGRGSSDHADPVFATAYPAIAGLGTEPLRVEIDPSPTWLEVLTAMVKAAANGLSDVNVPIYTIGHIETTDPRQLSAAGTGTGSCASCPHLCTGVGEDRLRSGFCPACRMAYKRAGSPDRSKWCRTRRAELAEPEQEAG